MSTRASLIVPSRDNVRHLSSAVESALATLAANDEILVVANGTPTEIAVTVGYITAVAAAAKERDQATIKCLISETPGYVASVNTGLQAATGQYLIIGNDDVIFTKNWLNELIAALVRATIKAPEIKWGFSGPHTNCGLPGQTLPRDKYPDAYEPALIENLPPLLAKCRHPEIVSTGALSGFCLLITRECYEAVGLLDDSYIGGGFTDNDWQLRGQEKGFLGVLAPRSFVYHVGNVSMTKYTPGHRGGVENLEHHLRKWRNPTEKFLTVCYRVQITNEADLNLFEQSLRKSKTIADACVILDDCSTYNLLTLLEVWGLRSWVKGYAKNPIDREFNEVRDRDAVIKLARETNPDWILNLDHDEILDPKVSRDDVQALMNPIDPAVKCYAFPIFTFWRGKEHVRLDNVWGTMMLSTMFKNDPCWGGIHQLGPNTFHCRRIPTYIPSDVFVPTNRLVVKHYGYCDYEKATAKRGYYLERDTDRVKKFVGNDDYGHLTDETSLSLLPYKPSTVTVAMLGRNEAFDVARQLRFWGGFANEIVVIDTGSLPTDTGLSLAQAMGVRTGSYRCCDKACDPNHVCCDFASARNFAIEQATSDFILFMDPDEEFEVFSASLLPKLLLQQADAYRIDIHNYQPDGKMYKTTQPRLFRRDPRLRYASRVHETLSASLKAHPELEMMETNLLIKHYGFLRITGEARKKKNFQYAELLVSWLEEHPEDMTALYAFAVHLNSNGRTDDGDALLDRVVQTEPNFFQARFELACRLIQRGVEVLLRSPKESIPQNDFGKAAMTLIQENLKFCKNLPQQKGVTYESAQP